MKYIKMGLFALYGFFVLYFVETTSGESGLLICVLTFPLSIWIVMLIHELSHWLCFKLFGFNVTELRVGLFVMKIQRNNFIISVVNKGFFRGYCSIDNQIKPDKNRLIVSLMAGGFSGLLLSAGAGALIISSIIPNRWSWTLASLICVGLYGFYATLLSPRSADRKLIQKILKE